MIVHRVGIGNAKEAFISDQFSKGTNIIFSDDNNRGKTILVQSMMYCIGNKPVFPVSFDFLSYFHYIEFSIGDNFYKICRKNNEFVVLYSETLAILTGETEFKHFWDKHICPLPRIEKDGMLKIVDFELLLELFFIGQDKRDTSNIISRGYYKKEDYINTIFSFLGLIHSQTQQLDIEQTKSKLKKYKEKKDSLLKEKPILESQAIGVRYLSSVSDKLAFEHKIKIANQLKDRITTLNSSRNSSAKQKIKYENVLKDLQSLNRTIDNCEIRCLDCKSTRIGFSPSGKFEHFFDVSTPSLRNEIIESIKEKITIYEEEILSYTAQISDTQRQLMEVLDDEEITLEMLVSFKDGVKDAKEVEQQIAKCDEEILKLENSLSAKNQINTDILARQESVLTSLVGTMNEAYRKIDHSGNLNIDNVFTQSKHVFSGSEETIFYIVKLYAIAIITKHNFPIVIDSFRAEDLSTDKENIVLKLFTDISNQKIFTTTLKKEEVNSNKYVGRSDIIGINFSSIKPSKLLDEKYVPQFRELLKAFSINI